MHTIHTGSDAGILHKRGWCHCRRRKKPCPVNAKRLCSVQVKYYLMKTLLLCLPLAFSLSAAEPTNAPATTNQPVTVRIPDASHAPVRVTNSVVIAGERVSYAAETGMLPVLKADGTSRASVFYVAYTRLDETNTATRPVTFCFNGGPGSASVWLHLGAFGPRRVRMNDNGSLPKPPFSLTDNEGNISRACGT